MCLCLCVAVAVRGLKQAHSCWCLGIGKGLWLVCVTWFVFLGWRAVRPSGGARVGMHDACIG